MKIIILFLTLFSIFSCSNRNSSNSTSKESSNSNPPDSTVISFLKWYHLNENRLHQINFIKGGLQDTTTFYSMDFELTEKYLSELSQSTYVSQKFISDLRYFFILSDNYLKVNPQKDGPAYGFEADLIMKSQDYMDVWESLDSIKTLKRNINGDKAIIKFSVGKYYTPTYNLTKIQDKWLIDSIYNVYSNN